MCCVMDEGANNTEEALMKRLFFINRFDTQKERRSSLKDLIDEVLKPKERDIEMAARLAPAGWEDEIRRKSDKH